MTGLILLVKKLYKLIISFSLSFTLQCFCASSASRRRCCQLLCPAHHPASVTQTVWWTAGAVVSPLCPPFTSCLQGATPSCWLTTSSPRWEPLRSPTSPPWRYVCKRLQSFYCLVHVAAMLLFVQLCLVDLAHCVYSL